MYKLLSISCLFLTNTAIAGPDELITLEKLDDFRAQYTQFLYNKEIRGHVFEGIYPQHPDFSLNPPTSILDSTKNLHGLSVYGLVFGKHGFLPNAKGYYTNYQTFYDDQGKGRRFDFSKVLKEEYEIMFQVSAWGHEYTDQYNRVSEEIDRIVLDLKLPIVQSLGNSGTHLLRPEALAKNVIAVGCVYHYNDDDHSNDTVCDLGGFGPTKDGRIKPDLVAYGDNVKAPFLSQGYTNFGGTSSATGIVGGYAGIVASLIKNGYFANLLSEAECVSIFGTALKKV